MSIRQNLLLHRRLLPAVGILAALGTLGIASSTGQNSVVRKKQVPVEIHIGRAPWCHGRGLCKLTPADQPGNQTGDASGLLTTDAKGRLILKLPVTTDLQRHLHQQTDIGSFQIESAIPLPRSISDALPRTAPATIMPGKYRTKRYSDTLYIFF